MTDAPVEVRLGSLDNQTEEVRRPLQEVVPEEAVSDGQHILGALPRAFASLLLMAVKAIIWPFYTSWLANHPEPAAQESLRVLYEQYGVWSGVQAAAVLLGLALLGYLLYRLSGGHAGRRLLPTIALVTFAIVFVGEFVGRMLFYVSMIRTGI